jgi:DNA-binding transcriptional LysR family regulator
MDMRRLETFCAVYEQHSFSRAGALLHLAQPTISSHISSLEKELETVLFDRCSRQVVPTLAAETLYAHARIIIEARKKATADIALLNGSVQGLLRLGGSTIPGHYILPGYMGSFQHRYPQVELQLEIGDSAHIENMVHSGALDIAVIGGRENISHLQYYRAAADELWLLAPSGSPLHPWKMNEAPGPDWPWIVREPGSGTRKAMRSMLEDMGISWDTLHIRATVTSTQAVLSCIQAGLGVSMVSSLAAAGPVERGEVIQLSGENQSRGREFYAVINAGKAQFPATRAFLRHIIGENNLPSA